MTDAPYTLWQEKSDPDAPFIVCAMFTPNYRALAQRLVASLDQLGLTYALFQVPTVHPSISPRGKGDLSVSKPRFIRFALERFGKPVLYVDCDMVFRSAPTLIAQLVKEGYDFAIYNWLADMMNDAWLPEPGTRLWKFFLRVELASDRQLMASGAVQLWRGTQPAFTLLSDWEQSLCNHPRSEDDHCLDFAYNHGDRTGLNPTWLPKSYCRVAYWIYVQPVIDHPQFPEPNPGHFHQLGFGCFDPAQLRRVEKQEPFPCDALINPATKRLLKRLSNGAYEEIGPVEDGLFPPVSFIKPQP